MRRSTIFVGVLLVLAGTSPARAAVTGSIQVSTVVPTVARSLYNAGYPVTGIARVFSVPASADGATYVLTKTAGYGNLDATFYTNAGGKIGDVCSPLPGDSDSDSINPTSESGTICGSPGQTVGWGVVILRWGTSASFTIDW